METSTPKPALNGLHPNERANDSIPWGFIADTSLALLEMVVYAGLPSTMSEWQTECAGKNKFLHCLRSHGLLVVTKDGALADEARVGA